jgi:sensor histidine kinase YesM
LVFLALFAISTALIGTYSFSVFNEITEVVIERGQSSVNTIAEQTDTAVSTVAQTHALLFSSEDIYKYLYKAAEEMPSYEWFQTYNSAQQILRLCGRGQGNLIMGMALYKSPREYIQYGSFYAMLNPYELDPAHATGLQIYKDAAYYVSASTMSNGSRAFLVSQLDNSVFDTISHGLLANDSTLLVMDTDQNVFKDYSSGKQDTALIRTALIEDAKMSGLLEGKWHLVSAVSKGSGLTFAMAFPVVSVSEKLMEVSPWFFPALLASLVAALLLSYGISKRLANGFRTMQENMGRVERKEYEQIKLIPSQDEFGQLSLAFDHMARHISTLIRENQERERKEHELEIQVLRAQVSPHFLYNALNNMRHLAQLQGMDHIDRMATSLIQLLRAALSNEGLLIPLCQELTYVENYYEICKYQYIDDFKLEMRVDEDTLDLLTPQMILQPIVENAIIHGISQDLRKGIIRIYAVKKGDDLMISVVDNGQGIDEKQLEELLSTKHNTSKMRFSGIGIHNVNERIRMRFGEKYGLHISSRLGAYTRVDILLPTVKKEGEA